MPCAAAGVRAEQQQPRLDGLLRQRLPGIGRIADPDSLPSQMVQCTQQRGRVGQSPGQGQNFLTCMLHHLKRHGHAHAQGQVGGVAGQACAHRYIDRGAGL
jgi:hypothetical protein